MKILTDEECIALHAASDIQPYYKTDAIVLIRAIEAAILERIGEPVAWSHNNGHIQCDGVGVPSHLYTVENGWTPLFVIKGVE